MGDEVTIRTLRATDRDAYVREVHRLAPVGNPSRRDPGILADWLRRFASGDLDAERPMGHETFVAVGPNDEPLGWLAIQPDQEYFTGRDRAYVMVLLVAGGADGRGIGRALMARAETWAREHGYDEIALDVFANNDRAHDFYARAGFRPDLHRLVKRLDD